MIPLREQNQLKSSCGANKIDTDDLFLPYHSNIKALARYKWNSKGYRQAIAANTQTLFAAVKARFHLNRTTPPVAEQVTRSEGLADYYGERIAFDTSHLYVAQSLLPFLWRRGDLGGRTFSVFMTRLPLQALHQRLDELAAQFPERRTFQEFRAASWMEKAEADALAQADQIITPHAQLASFFPLKSKLLDWKLPPARTIQRGPHIIFPGPAVARKGAFELRDAVQDLDLPLLVLNRTAESNDFWDSVRLIDANENWLNRAAVVVQPAFIENNPRPLLRALSAGIPVIATPECGIAEHPMLTLVPAGDAEQLRQEIQKLILRQAILSPPKDQLIINSV